MKILTYQVSQDLGLKKRMGILLDEKSELILDPQFCIQAFYEIQGRFNPLARASFKMPSLLSDFLSLVDDPIHSLQEVLELYQKEIYPRDLTKTKDGSKITFSLKKNSNRQLSAPLDKIQTYRDFYSFEEHVKKGFEKRGEKIPDAWYEIPVYYKGSTMNFIGPGETILWPYFSNKLDFELELAAVIGKEGKNLSEDKAIEHIFGFTILNDVSARDLQKKEMSVRLGPSKSKDFCSVIGPYIVTMDEFKSVHPNLKMEARINGELWSEGKSGDSFYDFSQMMAYASQDEWLIPGDLIGSGTVGTGCGLELNRWLKSDDVVSLFIENIGTLTNQIGKPEVQV